MQSQDAFDRQFPTDEACKRYLVSKRWPDGVRCPRCGAGTKVYELKSKPFHWACKNDDCGGRNGYRFSVLTATIFQDTKVGLKLWFKVGYLMLTAKKGLSAMQVHRVIFGEESGSDWRTSWYMCHRWRAAMKGDAFKLDGIVESDETFIGGKDKNRHWKNKSAQKRAAAGYQRPGKTVGFDKVGVIGAIARKGNVVCRVIGTMGAETKAGFVDNVLADDVELLCTDKADAFNYVRKDLKHEAVDHSAGEYVRGVVHTNNIEGFWSLIKRGVMGQYHHVSKKYLPLYLNEFSFRHNNRKNPDVFADLITTCGQ